MRIKEFNTQKITTNITMSKTKILMTSIVATILITGMIFMSSPQVFAGGPPPTITFCHSEDHEEEVWSVKTNRGHNGWHNGHEANGDHLIDDGQGGSHHASEMDEEACLALNNEDPIDGEKTWTHTDYNWEFCPGVVNPDDHLCYEDTEPPFTNNIDFITADINNEEHDVLADPLDQDNEGKYTVFAQVHSNNNEFSNTNPGAFYALTTVDVLADVDGLRVWENYGKCINQDPEDGPDAMDLKLISPADKPTRAVKAAIADPAGMVTEITEDLYDSDAITFNGVDDYDLKGFDTGDGFFDAMCDNDEMIAELIEIEEDVYEEGFTYEVNAALRIANDLDGDTVLDNQDNCPLDVNLDQADTDSDGAGDVCDVCVGDDFADTDNDGFLCFEDPDDNDDTNPGP
jgi:hypothetical protein